MPKIAVIGATTWGITLASVLSRKEAGIRILARTEEEASRVRQSIFKASKLPESFVLPYGIRVTADVEEATHNTDAVILAVPSQSMRANLETVSPFFSKRTLIISAAKGLEIASGKRMTQVIKDETRKEHHANICVLSGPNLAWEILAGKPAVAVVAAENESRARRGVKLINAPDFCAFTNTDVIGVELGGALKNIIALGAGVVDGLGYGDNTKAALMTRGLTEITALGTALGANPLTLSGLAGQGDLIATCSSKLSRNHQVGERLTRGEALKDIEATMSGVAEGVATTLVAWNLAQKLGIEMPITERLYRVLYQGEDVRAAVKDLMAAVAGHELAGRKWNLFNLFRRRKKPEITF
ncbi:MAG: NAD(P)H-dependent glycerol-3-phosphate dehydrogenase [Dehalogenimonas sp.]|uniref:Glycerol-3-phosphate dehydrogenase [NAD(P)+] n=1 Tax=Candidatus Dehalogenimonas loeffleri TaxID=3127115 RepID=A0ABZ2J681_9CHLR|nr:NAD(P)H-dependent glycerol-3-phosphate dehydrogenase [Dehalogenimonas sp.]